MITTKRELREFIEADLQVQPRHKGIIHYFFSDRIVKMKIHLRKAEYYFNTKKTFFHTFLYQYHSILLKLKLKSFCSEIPINCFDKGLIIWHGERILVNQEARIGKYCSLSSGVVIAQAHGKNPRIGDHCELMIDSTVLGGIHIADNVRIGAKALVIKDIKEDNTTWAGVPAKKISDRGAIETPVPLAM